MPRGRKPIPTQLKVVKGTARKGRMSKDEPRPNLAIPAPPDWLVGKDALMEWGYQVERLYRLGLLTEVDRTSLGQYCACVGRMAYAERKVAEMMNLGQELFDVTDKGGRVQHPYVGMANKASTLADKLGANFGLNPSARSRMSVKPPDSEEKTGFEGLGS